MIEAIKIWNEPNNLSHWDFHEDSGWEIFSEMVKSAARRLCRICPHIPLVLGGISPVDPNFMELMNDRGVLDVVDAVGVHGFPLDWNHWRLNDWPQKIVEIESVTSLPVWVTEAGVSSFGSDEIQVYGLKRTIELLKGRVDRVFWYSLLDLPPQWTATTRHQEKQGSSYYRHFYQGLVRADGTLKPAFHHFDPGFGICQWFSYEDPRLDTAVELFKRLEVKKIRTGISWADWHRPDAVQWFDRQMKALEPFDVSLTLCFTPPSRGRKPHHTSPPIVPEEFSWFADEIARRYIGRKSVSGQHRKVNISERRK
ncbi:MAG: beta-xylosidase [Chitinivibrionales bacterium]|nr:beta-xylosidase [Chitinivibrionales bacterium]